MKNNSPTGTSNGLMSCLVNLSFTIIGCFLLFLMWGFAQTVDNGGITEDDDTTNISSTPTKVKSDTNCNISGFANECDENASEAEIEVEE
jgi:hypothetical protein